MTLLAAGAAVVCVGLAFVQRTSAANVNRANTVRDIDLTRYHLTFSDEFDKLSLASTSPKGPATWYSNPPYGVAGNYSSSTWDSAMVEARDGILLNRALHTPAGWRSGNLSSVDETGQGFAQKYGYFEARIKMPDAGTGAWPAFWLMSTNSISAVSPTPSNIEEVDVLEWYGVNNSLARHRAVVSQASHNYLPDHTENPPGYPYLYSSQTGMPGGAYPWMGYHTYGVSIERQHITWYIDGVKTNQIATPTRFIASPFYMMLDYALGGGYDLSGMPKQSSMQVDWVRVYALN